MNFKWFLIIIAVALLSYLHVFSPSNQMSAHILHQELFFIPIILAGFWFRLPAGLIVATVISGIYALAMLNMPLTEEMKIAVYMQVSLYIGVGALIGWLTTQLHDQQEKMINNERRASLAKLGSALSLEICEIVNSLELKYKKSDELKLKNGGSDFSQEIDRLKRLTTAFNNIELPDEQSLMSKELNEVVKNAKNDFKIKAQTLGVILTLDLEEAGCPSMVFTESMEYIYKSLIANALEVSPKGSEVVLRTARTGTYCALEVQDNGTGVADENVSKLFRPFFSTKEEGHGLSLSSGRKVMRDHEGDLLYEPGTPHGAVFRMVVPRENRDKNVDTYINQQV
jgi:signal transduction histidine kinase